MTEIVSRHENAPPDENKSSTDFPAPVKDQLEDCNYSEQSPSELCAYVVVENWRYGQGSPFCDAPALAGRPYCAQHWALCHGAEKSPEAEPGAPPAELAHLAPVALPEAVEPAETLAELSLPAGAADGEV